MIIGKIICKADRLLAAQCLVASIILFMYDFPYSLINLISFLTANFAYSSFSSFFYYECSFYPSIIYLSDFSTSFSYL